MRALWVLTATLLACNSILGNAEGVSVERDVSANEGTETAQPEAPAPATSDPPPDASSSSSGSAIAIGDAAIAPEEGRCARGEKACGAACVATTDPEVGCGSSLCTPCETPNAVAACTDGMCSVFVCLPEWGDCNGLPVDGCETNLYSPVHCGACDRKCPKLPNAKAVCIVGACTSECSPGFADCNREESDGCETSLLIDRNHCGACGRRCPLGRCVLGECVLL